MKWIKASERLPENRRANYIFRQAGNIRSATSEYLAHAGNNIEGYFKLPLTDLEWLDESAQLSPGYSKEQMGEAFRHGWQLCYNVSNFNKTGYEKQHPENWKDMGWEQRRQWLRATYLRSLPPAKDAGVLVDGLNRLIDDYNSMLEMFSGEVSLSLDLVKELLAKKYAAQTALALYNNPTK